MKKIFFTICNYNAERNGTLESSMRRLKSVKDADTYIGVYDSGSKDKSGSLLSRYYKSGLVDFLMMSKRNMGKAYGMNRTFDLMSQMFNPAPDDILVNMDSDIQIMDTAFLSQLRAVFELHNPKYVGYRFFSDEAMTNETVNFYQNNGPFETVEAGGYRYDVLKDQHGVGGGIMAMRMDHYAAVSGYSETCGWNRTACIYSADDCIIQYKLFMAFPAEKALCCTDRMIVHFDTEDSGYKKWKDAMHESINKYGLGSDKLPNKGYYD